MNGGVKLQTKCCYFLHQMYLIACMNIKWQSFPTFIKLIIKISECHFVGCKVLTEIFRKRFLTTGLSTKVKQRR